jgi:large subunit ribosomal protein L30
MATVEKKKAAKVETIIVQQFGSPIRRNGIQRLYLKSLGLGKMNATREVINNQSTQGLLAKLTHMVRILEK